MSKVIKSVCEKHRIETQTGMIPVSYILTGRKENEYLQVLKICCPRSEAKISVKTIFP